MVPQSCLCQRPTASHDEWCLQLVFFHISDKLRDRYDQNRQHQHHVHILDQLGTWNITIITIIANNSAGDTIIIIIIVAMAFSTTAILITNTTTIMMPT